ncbi:protein KRI1 homolog [Chironomus tepperi]|uniref:protein KRI1 homolog n=1 Tax=Chironomus tepperi TaxID=113505 RepID=UPI00391F2A77
MSKKDKNFNKTLFDSDNEEDLAFGTNKSYAKHYDEFRKKEILSHLKNISDESSSDDDVSTDEELENPEFDKEFFNALSYLKNKDPSKYEEIPTFFKDIPTVEETVKNKQQSKSQKPITVADHQRERLIKTEGLMSDEEEQNAETNPEDMSYVAEQQKIKNELKKALSGSDDEDEFLQVRSKTNEEIQQEKTDYKKWLSEQKGPKSMKPLKDFWTSNELNKEDKFLRDYILNKRYLENGEETNFNDLVGISDDEAEFEKQTEYEHKYNFRFEEPDNEFIKRFPRKIDDTLRVEDTRRKEKRKEREERKAKEKELKMKDLRELQNIRKREIEEKLMVLKDVSGRDDFEMKEDDLNSDFDPAEHDKRMAALFDNQYYGIDEGEQKPQFPDIDEELNIEDWDNFDISKVPSPEQDEDEPHCEDDDFNMDCDYDPQKAKKDKIQQELIDMSKGRKRKKKVSKLAEIIKKDKPAFDPEEGKTYEEYLDEYYKLDYEDIIGDQPCRFNYVECVPNDFGLTVEEILMASNKELNQWASLKKTMQNRPKNVEMNDVEKYNRWRNNIALKKKIFKSMFGEASESEDDEGSESESKEVPAKSEEKTEAETPAKKKKKKNKKKKKSPNVDTQASTSISNTQKPVNSKQEDAPRVDNQSNKKKETESQQKTENKVTPTKQQNVKPQNSKVEKSKTENSKEPTVATEPTSTTDIPKIMTILPSRNHQNSNKRKLEGSQQQKNNFKKRKFDNKQNWKQNGSTTNGIADERLKAFGINPKKFHNKAKYGGQNQKNQNQTQKSPKQQQNRKKEKV